MAYYEDIVYENDEIKCILCDIVLLDNNASIDAHIDSDGHKELYINRLLLRNSMQLQTETVSCLMCNEYNIGYLKFGEHIRSKGHQLKIDNIKQIIVKDGSFIELPENKKYNTVNCLICNRENGINFTIPAIMDHVNSKVHRRARSIAVQPLNGIFSVEGSNKDLYCKICKVYFDNFIESIFAHVDDNEDHVTEIIKLLKLVDGQNISIEKFLVNPYEDKAECNKCRRQVSCHLDNLERHIKGKGKDKHNGSI